MVRFAESCGFIEKGQAVGIGADKQAIHLGKASDPRVVVPGSKEKDREEGVKRRRKEGVAGTLGRVTEKMQIDKVARSKLGKQVFKLAISTFLDISHPQAEVIIEPGELLVKIANKTNPGEFQQFIRQAKGQDLRRGSSAAQKRRAFLVAKLEDYCANLQTAHNLATQPFRLQALQRIADEAPPV